jgi:hypothetical protein
VNKFLATLLVSAALVSQAGAQTHVKPRCKVMKQTTLDARPVETHSIPCMPTKMSFFVGRPFPIKNRNGPLFIRRTVGTMVGLKVSC